MAHYTDKFGEFTTAEDLSFAALAKIEQVRADVADDRINKQMGDSHIRVIIGQDTGKWHFLSKDTDMVQYGIISRSINRIRSLISMTRENISSKMFDPDGYSGEVDRCSVMKSTAVPMRSRPPFR